MGLAITVIVVLFGGLSLAVKDVSPVVSIMFAGMAFAALSIGMFGDTRSH